MKKIIALLALLFGVAVAGGASAQYAFTAKAIGTCGTPGFTLTAGTSYSLFMDTTGTLCTAAGSGGGGTVTQGTAAVAAGAWPFYLVQGTTANSAGNPIFSQLTAGSAIVGKVGIDQTTPGTTNAVVTTNFPSSVSTGTGAQGASSPRVTVATDSATVAGSASLPVGANVIGKVSIDQTTGGNTNAVSVITTTSSNVAPTLYNSAAAESNHVIKASAGNLYRAYVFSTSAGLLMTFNSTTVPVDGAVTPIECIPVNANSSAWVDNGALADNYGTGISIALSSGTNCFSKTAQATAFFKVGYK